MSNHPLITSSALSRCFSSFGFLLLLNLGAQTARAAAPEAPPPFLRYNEDYSFMANPFERTEMFDVMKYISLDGAGYLSFGGEARERFESYTNETFNAKTPTAELKDDNSYLLQRYLFHADYHPTDFLRIFGQLQSSLEGGRYRPRVTDRDAIDLHQLFLDLVGKLGQDGVLTLRVGRQEISYGTERLVGVREGPNNRRAYDAARLSYKQDGVSLDAFFSSPVEVDQGQFDDQNVRDVYFWGTYATMPCPRLPWAKLDLYYLGLENPRGFYAQGMAREERHTIGTRFFGTLGKWDFNDEADYQFGQFGNGQINAWSFAIDNGYTWKALWGQPRLGLRAGAASGDNNPKDPDLQTFNPLFTRGNFFTEAGLLSPINYIDLYPSVRIKPARKLTLEFGFDCHWRANLADGIYRPPGIFIYRGNPDFGRYVGTELVLGAAYQVTRHIGISGAYSHFFAGQFIHQNSGDDADFEALWLTFRF